MPAKQSPIQVYVSTANKLFLKRYADEHNMNSISTLMRDALQEYFTNRGISVDMTEGINDWGKVAERTSEDA